MSEYDVIGAAIAAAMRIGWKFKATVVGLLLLVIVMKGYDIRLSQVANEKLDRNYYAFRGNERWQQFLTGGQHGAVLHTCTVHHANPIWENYPQIPKVDESRAIK